ncbi:MAG: helix-turn-helix transcriptional regulator [Clostridia bacterium]|nr:helix-turn-helix transcriptional regulator [Clostridia bacterium]
MGLGENVYKHRSAKNWSQTELAEALEVSRQSVSKWENNTAVPDLDKLIKMCSLFDISLDELVFGVAPQQQTVQPAQTRATLPPIRVIAGLIMIIFGMVFFLLSIFWGDHLYFGEAFGELLSAVIVLLGLALITTYDFKILAVCAVIYFIYSVICFGILDISSVTNYLFTSIAGMIILVWFIVCGLHATEPTAE